MRGFKLKLPKDRELLKGVPTFLENFWFEGQHYSQQTNKAHLKSLLNSVHTLDRGGEGGGWWWVGGGLCFSVAPVYLFAHKLNSSAACVL